MNEIPQTRQSLLIELGQKSEDAWAEFLAVYENALYRFCLAKGLQPADAQDVLQDVLAAVLKRIPSWDPDTSRGSFRGWLFRVARNIAVDAIVARGGRNVARGGSEDHLILSQLPASREHETSAFELQYQRSLFEWASSQVKSEVRDVTWNSFCMTAIEGRTADQVANELGVSVGSVYTAKCRVVARIRNKVAAFEQDATNQMPDLR